ncbi:hypothetical protein JNUCC0626_50080 (plasmid) [Lentzea sp. JNUCC 0626]|uniref:hypothetical protein n=1 Tax=Lentzea sp. JNUCC 0626 TaxID=3367513 RepID=UPI003747A7FF
MVSVSSDDIRRAFAVAAADSDPAAVANARQLISGAAERLDPGDNSVRAETLRGITTDGVNETQSN